MQEASTELSGVLLHQRVQQTLSDIQGIYGTYI